MRHILKPYRGDSGNISSLTGDSIPQDYEWIFCTDLLEMWQGNPDTEAGWPLVPHASGGVHTLIYGAEIPGSFSISASPSSEVGFYVVENSTSTNDHLLVFNAERMTILDIFGSGFSGVLDLRGFYQVTDLALSLNSFSSILLGPLPALVSLVALNAGTFTGDLVFHDYAAVDELYFASSSMSGDTVSIKRCPVLTSIHIGGLAPSTVILEDLPLLESLVMEGSAVTSLDISEFVTLTQLDASGSSSLASLSLPALFNGSLATVDVAGCALPVADLIALFTALPDRTATTSGAIFVTSNPGVGGTGYAAAKGAAQAKNWTVTDS